jgi:hypothetical protein
VLQAIATQAATFLKELHSIPPDEAFPGALARFDPLAEWADLYARIRERLFPHMRPDAREGVAQHFEAFLRDPGSAAIRPALTHGDYGGGNLLFDPQTQRLTGVIDFDHAGVGDPAVDFAAAQGLGLRRLAKVYPEVEAALDRVRFYGGTFALQEASTVPSTATTRPSAGASRRTHSPRIVCRPPRIVFSINGLPPLAIRRSTAHRRGRRFCDVRLPAVAALLLRRARRALLVAASEVATGVHVDDVGAHVGSLGLRGHQPLVLLGRHTLVDVGLAAVEHHLHRPRLSVVPHRVNHAGIDRRQLHRFRLFVRVW